MATLFFDIETRGLEPKNPSAALSPFTAQVASLSVYDLERARGTVYINNSKAEGVSLGSWQLKIVDEKTLLEDFWQGVADYDVYVGFATRRFDVPFLLHRSIANNIRTSQRLLNHPVLRRQQLPFHVDLQDEFSLQGTMSTPITLQLLISSYGIKNDLMDYEKVKSMIQEGDTKALFRHSKEKLLATVQLYKKWQVHIAPPHFLNAIEL